MRSPGNKMTTRPRYANQKIKFASPNSIDFWGSKYDYHNTLTGAEQHTSQRSDRLTVCLRSDYYYYEM